VTSGDKNKGYQNLAAVENPQISVESGQTLTFIPRDRHIIFHANSTPAFQIGSWLDSEDHALFQASLIAFNNAIPDIQTKFMTSAMGRPPRIVDLTNSPVTLTSNPWANYFSRFTDAAPYTLAPIVGLFPY
jgi:hypothetical protein